MGYLWLSRIIQLLQVRCAAILALRRQPHQELQAHGIHSRQHAISGSVDSANQKSLKLLQHRKGLPWTTWIAQQKSAKTCEHTQCCLRLLRSKNAEPCEAQCHNSAMSTTIKSCSNINIADAFHFPLGRWQLALEPGFWTESNQEKSCPASCKGGGF